jgi:GT2 family glycosyltransferase
MNNSDITVSVIIINYKTENLIINAISSVFEHTKDVSYEIIVVDNNSNDNSQMLLTNKFDDKIGYIPLKENIGFGKANNVGAKISNGKYLFFLNSDTILLNNSIKILSDFLENNENVGVCGGNLYTEDLKPTHSCMPILPSLLLEIDSVFGHIPLRLFWGAKFDFNTTNKPRKVADIVGADLMIRTNLFNKIEGFDPDFFLYNEESELAYRVKNNGYSVYCIPDAHIIHLEGKSMTSDISKRKFGLVSRKLYYKKTQKYFNRILIDLVFIIKCLLGIAISTLILKKNYVKYWSFSLKNGMVELW